MDKNNHLEKKLSEEPIILPANPLWEVFRVFGRDQVVALGINVIGTAAVAGFVSSTIILAVVGPAVEKLGFFIAYFKEAVDVYRTTSKPQRASVSHYASNAFKKGLSSLTKDVAAHDPIYAVLMYAGLNIYPQTPAWMLSVSAFIVALCLVAVGEVLITELRYYFQVLRHKRAGFNRESYLESRFYIKSIETEKVLSDFANEFNLTLRFSAKYHDLYFENRLKNYNGRKPLFRLRQRSGEDNQTVQIIYTKAAEMPNKQPGQFNYYPTKKDKMWANLSQEMPWKIEEISDKKLRTASGKIAIKPTKDIFFTREAVRNPKTILVSVDQVKIDDSTPVTIIEIKSYLDNESRNMLIKAMRYLMLKYEVIQTTHSKSALT